MTWLIPLFRNSSWKPRLCRPLIPSCAAVVHGPLLAAGPVLAGGRVVWGEQGSGVVRVRAAGGRVLYERRATPGGGVELLRVGTSFDPPRCKPMITETDVVPGTCLGCCELDLRRAHPRCRVEEREPDESLRRLVGALVNRVADPYAQSTVGMAGLEIEALVVAGLLLDVREARVRRWS